MGSDDRPSQRPATGEDELRGAAARGMSWTGLSTGVATALQLAQVAVLARLLDADEFGLMAITLGVVGFGQAFADMGISNVIIARRLRSRDVLSSLYWANAAGGVLVAGVIGRTSLCWSFSALRSWPPPSPVLSRSRSCTHVLP